MDAVVSQSECLSPSMPFPDHSQDEPLLRSSEFDLHFPSPNARKVDEVPCTDSVASQPRRAQ